jgi:dTDP-4-amino-4,6-dideoxygalactose transaminase
MHGVRHVTLCSSGTVAVELALRGLGIAPGDEVALAGYDFPGNFRAIEAIGARPVLVEVDPATWCIDPARLDEALGPQTKAPQTKAIVVSHLHGSVAPLDQIAELARRRGIAVVEDACQAPGAYLGDRIAGSLGDVGVLSFGGSKLLTAGRGGAVLTSLPEVHQRIKIFSDRGNQAYPLSELQAAVLLPQTQKLAQRNLRRASAIARLRELTADLDALAPITAPQHARPVYYKHAWRWAPQRSGATRDDFVAAIRAEGVAVDAGFRGFARRTERRGRRAGPLPHCQAAAEATILLHHPILLEDSAAVERAALALRKVARSLDDR